MITIVDATIRFMLSLYSVCLIHLISVLCRSCKYCWHI